MSANWNNPTTSSTYANFVEEVKAATGKSALADIRAMLKK